MSQQYAETAPTRPEVDAMAGPVVVDFGTNWCGHCRAALPIVDAAFADHPQVRHIKVEDGSGRLLGRSFNIKLWPTLVFMQDGKEAARLVRPLATGPISAALAQIDS